MTARADIPLTVLGGFLGAGKTSLLNHLLRTRHAERILVMVNDFGALNIDAELIDRDAPGLADGIISLTSGCVCCAVGDDLMQAFLGVLSLPKPPDRVVVEASGVGDPARIAQLGRAGGGYRGDGVVTVLDASAIRQLAADEYVGDTVRAQLHAADLLLLNKTDLVDSRELEALRAWLATVNPAAPVAECQHGRIDPRVILGPDAGRADLDELAAAPAVGDDPGIDHATRFTASSLVSKVRFRRALLEARLDALPQRVLRAKGMVFLDHEPGPRLLQVCGRRWTLSPPASPAGDTRSRVVFIAVKDALEPAFDPSAHFKAAMVDGT